jgi:phage/plasmid-associated DNA primase
MCLHKIKMGIPVDNNNNNENENGGSSAADVPIPGAENKSPARTAVFLPKIRCKRNLQMTWTVEQAEEDIKQHIGKGAFYHLTERFVENREVNPYYDWDAKFKEEQPPEVQAEHLELLRAIVGRLHPECPPSAFVFMKRHGWVDEHTWKLSWLAKVCGTKARVSDILVHMQQVLGEDLDHRLDLSVYKETEQLLSVVYASKDTDPMKRVRLPAEECEGRPIRDFLCGFPADTDTLMTVEGVEEKKEGKKTGKKEKKGKKEKRAAVVGTGKEAATSMKAVAATFLQSQWHDIPCTSVHSAENKGDRIYVNLAHECKIKGAAHESNNTFVFLFPDRAIFKCHDEECKKSDGVEVPYPQSDIRFPWVLLARGFDGSDHALAETFASWYRDVFIYSNETYYQYEQHRYSADKKELRLKRFLGATFHADLTRALEGLDMDEGEEAVLRRAVAKTRSAAGKANLVSELASFINIGDGLDQDPYLMGMENGVLDLRACEFRAGKTSDRISRSTGSNFFDANHPYDHEEDEEFQSYMRQIYPDDYERTAVMQICGYVLLGIRPEKLCFLFTDYRDGFTAKSTLFKFFRWALGRYYRKGRCEDLGVNRNPSTQGHSSNWLGYKDFRLIGYEEFDADFRVSWGTIKDWTGGCAEIVGRDANIAENVTIQMRAAIFMAFNITAIVDLEKADAATIARLILIPHRAKFHPFTARDAYDQEITDGVPHTYMADPNFDEKIQRLAPYFLKWCLAGLAEYHSKRFSNLPASFSRFKNDIVQQPVDLFEVFVTECLRETEAAADSVNQAGAYAACKKLAAKKQLTCMSSTSFGMKYREYMTKKLGPRQPPAAKKGDSSHRWQEKKGGMANVAVGFQLVERQEAAGN